MKKLVLAGFALFMTTTAMADSMELTSCRAIGYIHPARGGRIPKWHEGTAVSRARAAERAMASCEFAVPNRRNCHLVGACKDQN